MKFGLLNSLKKLARPPSNVGLAIVVGMLPFILTQENASNRSYFISLTLIMALVASTNGVDEQAALETTTATPPNRYSLA